MYLYSPKLQMFLKVVYDPNDIENPVSLGSRFYVVISIKFQILMHVSLKVDIK